MGDSLMHAVGVAIATNVWEVIEVVHHQAIRMVHAGVREPVQTPDAGPVLQVEVGHRVKSMLVLLHLHQIPGVVP